MDRHSAARFRAGGLWLIFDRLAKFRNLVYKLYEYHHTNHLTLWHSGSKKRLTRGLTRVHELKVPIRNTVSQKMTIESLNRLSYRNFPTQSEHNLT